MNCHNLVPNTHKEHLPRILIRVECFQILEWILVYAVLRWVVVPRELPWNSPSLWTPCMADCFHRPEESFSGPWCQDEGIKCQLSVRFIEEWNRLCVISHAGTSRTRSYRLILCASVCGCPSCTCLSDTSLLVSDWEDGRVTAASSCPPWRTLESLSMSNLQEGTSISLLGKMKLIVGRDWRISESQRMGLTITDGSFHCLVCQQALFILLHPDIFQFEGLLETSKHRTAHTDTTSCVRSANMS